MLEHAMKEEQPANTEPNEVKGNKVNFLKKKEKYDPRKALK